MNGLNKYSTTIIVVIFCCVTFLTYAGKIPAHTISALIGMIVGWMLKQGATTVAEVRAARSTPLPTTPRDRPPMPVPSTPTSFETQESPTARTRRSDAVTQPMEAFQKANRDKEKK